MENSRAKTGLFSDLNTFCAIIAGTLQHYIAPTSQPIGAMGHNFGPGDAGLPRQYFSAR